jgi:hypothetical protein
MRRLIATFAAATLLMHAFVGCCWHHQHLEAAACSDETQLLPVVCGGHFHSHADHDHDHGDEPASPADHRHSNDDGCGETTCQFVKVDSTITPSLLDGPAVAIVDASQPVALNGRRLRAHDHRDRHILEGVPLHLRHQVLVI